MTLTTGTARRSPILFDAPVQGKPRKLVRQAARNGYFFVLDRATGEHLLTEPLVDYPELGDRNQREGAADSQSDKKEPSWMACWWDRVRRRTGRRRVSIRRPDLFYVGTSEGLHELSADDRERPEGYGFSGGGGGRWWIVSGFAQSTIRPAR